MDLESRVQELEKKVAELSEAIQPDELGKKIVNRLKNLGVDTLQKNA